MTPIFRSSCVVPDAMANTVDDLRSLHWFFFHQEPLDGDDYEKVKKIQIGKNKMRLAKIFFDAKFMAIEYCK